MFRQEWGSVGYTSRDLREISILYFSVSVCPTKPLSDKRLTSSIVI